MDIVGDILRKVGVSDYMHISRPDFGYYFWSISSSFFKFFFFMFFKN